MNNKLQDLIEQSTTSKVDESLGVPIEEQIFDIGRFAELVMRESIKKLPLDIDHIAYTRVVDSILGTFDESEVE